MAEQGARPIRQSLQEYGRGVAGGMLFSLPLLFTMEVWWTSYLLRPGTLLLCIVTTFLLLIGYNTYGGMRRERRFIDVLIESVEELGIGLLLGAGLVVLLGRVSWEMAWLEILAIVVVESMIVSIGVSVGTAQLGLQNDQSEPPDDRPPVSTAQHLLRQGVLGFCGAILFAANVGPTDEIVVIAQESSSLRLLCIAAVTLATGALILTFSDFYRSRPWLQPKSLFTGAGETLLSYIVALAASALMLWFFQRFNDISWHTVVAETIVLAFAGNLGASAGRLLIG